MLHYFALYVRDIEYHPDQEPTGLIVKGPGTREALMYDHRAGAGGIARTRSRRS
ncbi:hypothetical protein ACFQZ4_14425 [Catellatospora coxensis]